MKKHIVTILAIALVSMLSTAIYAQPNRGKRRPTPTTTTPTAPIKKPTNNSTDSVADYNRQSRQQNGSKSTSNGQGGQYSTDKDILEQNGTPNRRANNTTQSANSANAPTKPCNQLTGDDWLFKGRKCPLPNGQVTPVGAYQNSQNQTGSNGQDRGRYQMGGLADGKSPRGNRQGNRRANQTPNGTNQMLDDAELQDVKPNSPQPTARSKPKTKVRPKRVP